MYLIDEYFRPRTTQQLFELLESVGESRLLAGGTDVLPSIRTRGRAPKAVVDIKALEELYGIEETPEGALIGALTTVQDVHRSPFVNERFPVLSIACGQLGSVQIRNRATLGGNLCNASPAAETACPLLVYNAKVMLLSKGGCRSMPLHEFYRGPGRTACEQGEILKSVALERPRRADAIYVGAYEKLGPRSAMDIALVNVAVLLGMKDRVCCDARVALGSVAPTAFRCLEAEEVLEGRIVDEGCMLEAGEAARIAARPISDIRASAEYRRAMVETLTIRALKRALGQVGINA